MEDLLSFKQAQIEALQKKIQEMQTELDTAKELLKGIVKEYEKPCCGNWDELGNCKCKQNG